MSSRGVLHGSFATLLVAFVTVSFSIFSPSWLVLRTELEQKQCWLGEGIYTSRAYWGSDLSSSQPCRDVRKHNPGPISTYDAYCSSKAPQSAYSDLMCAATQQSKVIAVVLLGFSFFAPVLAFALIWLKRHPKFALNQRLTLAVFYSCLFAALMSFLCMILLAITMYSSPLFSSSHIADLSHEFNKGLPFTGDFSCAFQTPLHSVFSLFSSGPMQCVFPGPSSCCFILGMLTQSLSLSFLFRFFVDLWAVPPGYTMLRGASEAATPRQEEEFLREVSRRRRYSIYGAFRRRFASMHWAKRVILLNILPATGMLCTIVAWLAYNLLGIQIIVITQVSVVKNSELLGETYTTMHLDNSSTYVVDALMQRSKSALYFEDILNVFNFSPLTSIKYFWLNEAYILAVAVFISVLVLPVFKTIITIWFFYAPAKEQFRGRVLSTLDWVGKYSLANLYIMSFLAIALTFNSNFIVIPVSRTHSLRMNIRAGMNAGNGLGSYMFVLTTILSLVIGQMNLQFHAYAGYWEEDRRAADSLAQPRGRRRSIPADSTVLPSPLIAPEVVPTLRSMASSHNLDLNVLQVLDENRPQQPEPSTSTTAPLLREYSSSSSRNNLVRALANYGSRTALDVLLSGDSTDEDEHMNSYDTSNNNRVNEIVPFHPYVEAMCDRILSPVQGARIKFTPRGKIVSWLLLFLVVGFMLVCQSWDLVEIHQNGIAGDIIVKPQNRFARYSLVSLTSGVARTGISVPAIELSFLFFIMTAVMPVLTALGLAMMWAIPLTLRQQTILFTWLEIACAWSSLDIFFISIVCILIELHDVTEKILSDAVPNLSELIRIFLPFEDGVMSAEIRVLSGFWLLFAAVIVEKIAIYVITEGACQAITERRVEQFLRTFLKQQHDADQDASTMDLNQLRTLLGDASQGLLESDAIMAFAPIGRYASVLFPKQVYAGFPRSWWVNLGIRCGVLADARTVDYYDKTGRWLQDFPTGMTLEENEGEGQCEQRQQQQLDFRSRAASRHSSDDAMFF